VEAKAAPTLPTVPKPTRPSGGVQVRPHVLVEGTAKVSISMAELQRALNQLPIHRLTDLFITSMQARRHN
jgi:hypothetical protein